MSLPNGLIAVVKRDCPTCLLVDPVLVEIQHAGKPLTVYVQDDPSFTQVAGSVDDRDLAQSFRLGIEIVPTLIEVVAGQEVQRTIGWVRSEWAALTGLATLGADLPAHRPGCGSKSVEPGIAEQLAVRYGHTGMTARRVSVPPQEDDIEVCFERGWSDGLPVVPPSETRVYRPRKCL